MKLKAALLIFFVSLIVYSNSLGGEFIYDDEYFIVKNISIRNLGNLPRFFTDSSSVAFSGLAKDVYRPVTASSYAIDYKIGKLNTFGYHLTNVLFHSLNGILIFVFLYIILGNVFISLAAGLLFVCHPVQTEVVSWISGRSSVLFLFFYLLSLIFYIKYEKTRSSRYIIYSLATFAASLFSKEMAVTLPLIIIVYDIHFSEPERLKNRLQRYLPYIFLVVVFLAARSFALGRVSQCGWWGDSPYYTFYTMSRVMVEYLKLLVFPVNLCAYHIVEISKSIADTRVLLSLSVLLCVAGSLLFLFKKYKILSFSIFWFFITILPVSNIIPLKALMAERFLYIPSIGFCIFLAVIIHDILGGRYAAKSGILKTAVYALAVAIVIFYSLRTVARNEDWKDPISISKNIVEVYPLNPWGYASLGSAYLAKGDIDKGIKALKKSITLSPDYTSPKNILGACYIEMGMHKDAVDILSESISLEPDNVETLNSLGIAYAQLDKYDEALKYFEKSINIDARFVNAYLNKGATYERMSLFGEALNEYAKVSQKTNSVQDMAIADIRSGDLYLKMGDRDKAASFYKRAFDSCTYGMEILKKVAEDKLKSL